MRLLICGDREWTDVESIRRCLEEFVASEDRVTVIHGCARGADRIAGACAEELGLDVEEFPYVGSLGRAGGPVRNRQMLDSGVDLVVAFHSDLAKSRGTANMVSQARRDGVTVEIRGQV